MLVGLFRGWSDQVTMDYNILVGYIGTHPFSYSKELLFNFLYSITNRMSRVVLLSTGVIELISYGRIGINKKILWSTRMCQVMHPPVVRGVFDCEPPEVVRRER
jgi:hypothetical protein